MCDGLYATRFLPAVNNDLTREIQDLCRLMLCTNDEQFLQELCLKLRKCLHERSRQANDPASEMLAKVFEEEERLKAS